MFDVGDVNGDDDIPATLLCMEESGKEANKIHFICQIYNHRKKLRAVKGFLQSAEYLTHENCSIYFY